MSFTVYFRFRPTLPECLTCCLNKPPHEALYCNIFWNRQIDLFTKYRYSFSNSFSQNLNLFWRVFIVFFFKPFIRYLLGKYSEPEPNPFISTMQHRIQLLGDSYTKRLGLFIDRSDGPLSVERNVSRSGGTIRQLATYLHSLSGNFNPTYLHSLSSNFVFHSLLTCQLTTFWEELLQRWQ